MYNLLKSKNFRLLFTTIVTTIKIPGMLRSDVAVTTLSNKIYAVGGYNGATGLKSAESYDPELNIWQKVSILGG